MKTHVTRLAFTYGTAALTGIVLARLFLAWLDQPIALLLAMSDGLFLCH
jgi:hypothetical protein